MFRVWVVMRKVSRPFIGMSTGIDVVLDPESSNNPRTSSLGLRPDAPPNSSRSLPMVRLVVRRNVALTNRRGLRLVSQ